MPENIKIAIFGPVSAGKTTFFNGLMSNKCSGMARKKTTMLPQIYQMVNDGENIDTIEEIYQKNKTSNEEILKLREDGEFKQDCHFTELIYNINPIPDFIQLPDMATYSILDMPGLNCAGDTLYYDYVAKISATVDIYLIVFDINSGLNTTDEIGILKFLVEQIQQNNHGYLHILINKCDNIVIDGDNIILEDDELNELYTRMKEAIHKYCAPIHNKVSFSPLCSQKLYIYRSVQNDITTIEEVHLNDIISEEIGKKGLREFPNIAAKREYVSGLISSPIFGDWIKNTGYNKFLYCLDQILKNYSEIMFYHINSDLVKLQNVSIDSVDLDINSFLAKKYFDVISEEIRKINIRIQKVMQYSEQPIPQYLLDNLEIINTKLNEYLIDIYSTTIKIGVVENVIRKINDYYEMLKNLCKSNPLETANSELSDTRIKLLVDTFIITFNGDIFIELHNAYFYEESGTYSDDRFIDDIFNNSIKNTLSKDMDNIIYISDVISQFDPSNKFCYMEKLIEAFIELLGTHKIDPTIFLQFLPKFIICANEYENNLILISKAITNFMITNFTINGEALYTKIICTDWKVLKASAIEQSGRKVQYIYLSRTFKTFNSVDSIFEKIDYATYDNIMNTLDLIFEVLNAVLNT